MNATTTLDRKELAQFLQTHIQPFVEEADEKEHLPEEVIATLATQGYLGATLPQKYGGLSMTQTEYAILTEEMGKICSSCRSLLTVHLSLVAETILRWGTSEQKNYWLPALASGKKIAAFCLTEKSAGSNPKDIQATYLKKGDTYHLKGTKKWTTFGQRADVYLVLAKNEETFSAFLVE
ncbi:MAG: acyl-CoA dehydrogenase family protein, partial [Bacteroidota bacterium]